MSKPEFKRLLQYEDKLDHCIRCGYCYEHCPIYKHTRWETDAPRAKLALCYGMLVGDLPPSDYIATKLHECFFCKRCETNCSAGVPLTEVFQAARADLHDLGYEPQGTTSGTDYGLCARCLNCVRMCPHEARSYDYEQERVVVDTVKCQSCGNCIEVCPRIGIDGGHSFGTDHDAQIAAVRCYLDALDNQDQPKAVVFNCNWSTWPGFQSAVGPAGVASRGYETLVNVCAGRLQVRTLMDVLRQGAWGLLVTACPEDECDHGGSKRAQRRIEALRKDLPAIGIDPRRIQIIELPKGDQKGFNAAVDTFVKDLRELGPLYSV